MDNTTVVWIVVAVAAVIVIALLVFAALRKRNERRHLEAQRIREDIDTHTSKVEKRQAIADETSARARAAEAEAQAKAAEAARLKEQAANHHDAVATSREEIEERRRHADRLDPKTRVRDEAADPNVEQNQNRATPDPAAQDAAAREARRQ